MTTVIHLPAGRTEELLEPRGVREGADAGNPLVRATSVVSSSGTIGVWECEPGGFPVVDRANTEVCHVQSGEATITNEDGTSVQVVEGDVIVLPAGWTGRWDVHETMRKTFVTY